MNVQWKEINQNVSVGTLQEIAAGATLNLKEDNLAGDKRVVIYVRKDGKELQVVCSPRLSAKIRDKEIKLSNLPSFQVSEATSLSGETILMLTTSSNEVSVKMESIKPQAYQPKKFNPEDLIAF